MMLPNTRVMYTGESSVRMMPESPLGRQYLRPGVRAVSATGQRTLARGAQPRRAVRRSSLLQRAARSAARSWAADAAWPHSRSCRQPCCPRQASKPNSKQARHCCWLGGSLGRGGPHLMWLSVV